MKCSPGAEVYGAPVGGLSIYPLHWCNSRQVLPVEAGH